MLIIFSTGINADFEKGVKFGISYNNIEEAKGKIYVDSESGYNLGVFLKYNINEYFFVSSELLYNKKGFTFERSEHYINKYGRIEQYVNLPRDSSNTVDFIEIPLLFGAKYKYVFAYGGLFYSRYVHSVSNPSKNYEKVRKNYYDGKINPNCEGYIFGFGGQIKNFFVDFRYSKTFSEISYFSGEFSTYINSFYQYIFSAGIVF